MSLANDLHELRVLILALADARTPSEHDRSYEATLAVLKRIEEALGPEEKA